MNIPTSIVKAFEKIILQNGSVNIQYIQHACVFVYKLCKVIISPRGEEVPTQHLVSLKLQSEHCTLMGEREGTLEKVNFQQILGKTFLPLLPPSALFKHYGLPVLQAI